MPSTLDETNETESDVPSPTGVDSSIETNEASVIVSRSDITHKNDEVTDLRANLELRKDLLIEPSLNYVNMDDENGLFKSENLVPEEELEHHYLDSHRHSPSYATLTRCHVPTVIHQEDETPIDVSGESATNLTLIPNMLNFNPSCWVPSHEESTLLGLPSSHQLGSSCHFPSTISTDNGQLEYSQPSFMMMMEDPFKSVPMISNALYHLDTNNRRIWVPESCSNRGGAVTDRNNSSSRSQSAIRLTSVQEGDVFMAAEFENEDLLLQHAVNIERFPNRCWRGSNPSRAQYEKGTNFSSAKLLMMHLQVYLFYCYTIKITRNQHAIGREQECGT